MKIKLKQFLVGMTFLMVFSTAVQAVPVPYPEMVIEPDSDYLSMDTEFARLQISPRYENFQLQPGDSDTTIFKVKNTGNETVTTDVKIENPPYSEYFMEANWVTVTPDGGKIKPGESIEFTVSVHIPEDSDRGYYSVQIVFTNDTLPTPYPSPFPDYINSARLSVDVWVPPVVQIQNQYIHDLIEAGGEYDYEIKLKNTGSEPISIDPEMDRSGRYYEYGPFGMAEPMISDEDITIVSPATIIPGETAVVTVHIKVPNDAKGYYNGIIDLNIVDPSINEWEGQVQLDFQIWKQPTEPFIKKFTIREDSPVTIDVISDIWDYGPGFGTGLKKEPSFEVDITDPSGVLSSIEPSKIVIGGSVDLGMERYPPWEVESEGMYQENRIKYVEIYSFDGKQGEWSLNIMPHNTNRFEYNIQIGE